MDNTGSTIIMLFGYGYTFWGAIGSNMVRVVAGLGLLLLVGLDKK